MNGKCISAAVTNLGMYVEGSLNFRWLDFPTSKEEVQKTLSEIGIDGKRYEEIFITDYDTTIENLTSLLGEYESIDEINYLASLLENLSVDELEKFEAILEYNCQSVKDAINILENNNLDCFYYLSGVTTEEELGYYWADANGIEQQLETIGDIGRYFDYAAYGKDLSFDGTFTTNGFIESAHATLDEEYDGIHVPKEHKVFMPLEKENQKMQGKTPKNKCAR